MRKLMPVHRQVSGTLLRLIYDRAISNPSFWGLKVLVDSIDRLAWLGIARSRRRFSTGLAQSFKLSNIQPKPREDFRLVLKKISQYVDRWFSEVPVRQKKNQAYASEVLPHLDTETEESFSSWLLQYAPFRSSERMRLLGFYLKFCHFPLSYAVFKSERLIAFSLKQLNSFDR